MSRLPRMRGLVFLGAISLAEAWICSGGRMTGGVSFLNTQLRQHSAKPSLLFDGWDDKLRGKKVARGANDKGSVGHEKSSEGSVVQPLDWESLLPVDTEIPEGSSQPTVDDDGIFLDADTYLKLSRSGSLEASIYEDDQDDQDTAWAETRLDDMVGDFTHTYRVNMTEKYLVDMAIPPNAPLGMGGIEENDTSVDREPTIQDVIELYNKRLNEAPNPAREREIYDRVFENEQAHLRQSKLFLEGYTNETAAQLAFDLRRTASYRKQQKENLDDLETALQEFERELEESGSFVADDNPEVPPSAIAEPGIREADITKADEPFLGGDTSEWVRVEDPTTSDEFYWNSITGEMTWEPPT